MTEFGTRTAALEAFVDAVVPPDEFPSASQAGMVEFLRRIEKEKPEWTANIDAALDGVARHASIDEDEHCRWLARLVSIGFYGAATPDGRPASWEMLDWSPDPLGGWPQPLPSTPFDHAGWIGPDRLRDSYDVIVVGTGAGGGTVAEILAESGRSVLLLEAGGAPSAERLSRDHLRNPRVNFGLDALSGPVGSGWPRTVETADGPRTIQPSDPRWSNNAMTLGGGTRVYGGQAWRFAPQDFAMASTYGVPDGSALADWPIGYDDLEPFYSLAEWRFGVSGRADGDPWAGTRSRDYPMPPLTPTAGTEQLASGAKALGWSTLPVPLLINSREYDGRAACVRCAQCVGFACPAEAKAGTHNTAIPRALATGRCSLVTSTTASRLLTDGTGRVTGVEVVGEHAGTLWRKEIRAAEVTVAAGAIESARLLLNSRTDREPHGIGNNQDQVGRHLQGHVYGGAVGVFDEEVADLVGPGPTIATCDFRHRQPGLVGGGMIANEFVPTPASTYTYLVDAGIIPAYGLASKQGMRHWARRMQRIVGPYQEMTSAEARVRLDPRVTDRYGVPVARLSGTLHPEDHRGRMALGARAAEWLRASGAVQVVPSPPLPATAGPSGGQHQAGTCRMGTDPVRSVTDPWCRVWGHPNLRVVDAAVHVTNGGVNPVLTILANAMRIGEHMRRDS